MASTEQAARRSALPTTRWDFAVAIGTASAVGLAGGLTLPLVSVRLDEAGASDALIATFGALPAVGMLIVAPMLPWLTRWVPSHRLLIGAMTMSTLALLALWTPFQALPWSVARIITGASAALLFAVGETRILELSGAATRARWTALYATCLTACQLVGPAMLAALGVRSAWPVAFAVLLQVIAILLLWLRPWQVTTVSLARGLSLPAFLGSALPLAMAVGFFALFDSVVLALLPVYGLQAGFGERSAVLMASVALLGDSCLQLLLGWAADRLGRERVHVACGLLTVLCAALLSSGPPSDLFWPLLFLLGGFAGGIYTLAIVRIGDQLSGARLLAANAYVSFLWGLGSLAGPLAAGGLMQWAGGAGLFRLVALAAAVFLVSCLRRLRGREAQEPGVS